MNEQHLEEEFKTTSDMFGQELDALEQHTHGTASGKVTGIGGSAISRMSLFKQFDPLVGLVQPVNSISSIDETNVSFSLEPYQQTETIDDESVGNTLIHLNTPIRPNRRQSSQQPLAAPNYDDHTNGHMIRDLDQLLNITINGNDQPINHHDQEGILQLQTRINELVLINEQLYLTLKQQLTESQNEIDRLNAANNGLAEELNMVEKNYYDTHSRYENLRAIVKEMDEKEESDRQTSFQLAEKLKEREDECLKWKHEIEK